MRVVSAVLAAAVLVACVWLGYRAGAGTTLDALVGDGEGASATRFGWMRALGFAQYHGSYGQDVWLLRRRFPGVDDGWFVDLGAADGIEGSATKALESHGWNGLCIDPFPRNMVSRRCRVVAVAVDAVGGRVVPFQEPGSVNGGILEYAGWWVDAAQREHTVDVHTERLAAILDAAGAPPFIHYLNVDIEGAEYEALRDFPFDRYRFGAITIEHNNVEPRRQRIRRLLEANGYRLEWAIRDQDWYVPMQWHADGPGSRAANAPPG